MALDVARNAASSMRPGGTLLLMEADGGREIEPFTTALAVALAPIRVRVALIAPDAALAVQVMASAALTPGPRRAT